MPDFLPDSSRSTAPTLAPATLAQELLTFYDDFVEFHSCCAFLCDAITAMAATGIELDEASQEGAHIFSSQIKHNAQQLKDRLQVLQEMSCIES